ncbi:hypothetical protein KDU71_16640 [Carboxylicivirga sediminis]|uniref:Uncharacterized protein n=1 Tax=Carboxylicivirga sediminis TaxID=2006564 RepID=A0A941F8N9_9BACT|nr:hypothetical protein [Carboxylicivirga sediminis]MBR8537200.1 hypothetical protein [Carboxylicivirga sediminis]
MKAFFPTTLLLTCIIAVNAQINPSFTRWEPREIEDIRLDEITGSPYLIDSFQNGFILLESELLIPLKLRYNIHTDAIEFRHDEKTYQLQSHPNIKMITIADRVFQFLEFKKSNTKTQKSYLELIADGKVSLYCRHQTQYYPNRPNQEIGDSYNGLKKPEYITQSLSYFSKLDNEMPVEFNSPKQLYTLLNSTIKDQAEIISEKNKTRFWNKNDLIDLFNQLNNPNK